MILEKIIQDYTSNISIVFFQDLSDIVITKLPKFYKPGTQLELGTDHLYHPIQTEETKESIQMIDSFFSEIVDQLPLDKIDHLIEINDINTHMNLYQMYQSNVFELLNIKDRNEHSVLSITDVLKIANPITFEQKQIYTLQIIQYAFENLKETTGSTCFSFLEIYQYIKQITKNYPYIYTKEELSAYFSYYQSIFVYHDANIKDTTMIALIEDYQKEAQIYQLLQEYLSHDSPFSSYYSPVYSELSDEQNNACQNLIPSNGLLSILSGGPGTGKTTILKKIVNNMKICYPNEKIALLAPTGKAAKRISEVMPNSDFYIGTIHKFLGYKIDGSFIDTAERNQRLDETHCIIIDESSMLGISLFYTLLENINKEKTKVILVGDIHQLPSIEAGCLLRDLQLLNIPTYTLTRNYRSVGVIIQNSYLIKDGLTELSYDQDTFCLTDDDIYDKLSELTADDSFDTIILSPYKKEIKYSTDKMNETVHKERLYYDSHTKFNLNDKVLITHTKYQNNIAQYVNGDIGIVQSIYRDEDGSYQYAILLQDQTVVRVPETDLDFAYTLTIHKSQGSEYQIVHLVIPYYSDFITRRMLYTAITRAKEKIIIHSTKEIITKIIKNDFDYERKTILQQKTFHHI